MKTVNAIMNTPALVLKRHGKLLDWIFCYELLDFQIQEPTRPSGYIHRTNHNVYQLFIDNDNFPDVWVGRYVQQNNKNIWYTVDRELKAKSVQFGRGTFMFRI